MQDFTVGASARDFEWDVVDFDVYLCGGCVDVAGTESTGANASLTGRSLFIAFHAPDSEGVGRCPRAGKVRTHLQVEHPDRVLGIHRLVFLWVSISKGCNSKDCYDGC